MGNKPIGQGVKFESINISGADYILADQVFPLLSEANLKIQELSLKTEELENIIKELS